MLCACAYVCINAVPFVLSLFFLPGNYLLSQGSLQQHVLLFSFPVHACVNIVRNYIVLHAGIEKKR